MEAIREEIHLGTSVDNSTKACYSDTSTNQEEECDDKNIVCVSREYLPESDGGVCDERLGEEGWLEQELQIESAATSTEELGSHVYPPAKRMLWAHGISCDGKIARQLTNHDYEKHDMLIGMDQQNLRDMYRICGGDFSEKIHLLLDFTEHPGNIADPWYTEDFVTSWMEIKKGCQGLLDTIMQG